MYVRFVSAWPHPTLDAELGMFSARHKVDFSNCKGSIQKAHEEAFAWFIARGPGGLTFPRLRGRARTTRVRKSLFWFKPDAAFCGYEKGSIIRRARELAAALTSAGCEIRELRVKDPGEIVWEDCDQVLAYPTFKTIPRAFAQS